MTPSIHVNLSIPSRAAEAASLDVAGVGLLRAEFLIYQTGRHPLILLTDPPPNDLTAILGGGIRTVAREFGSRPVLYRSMDLRSNELRNLIGGEGFEQHEDNPALGCRGLSRAQRDPDVFQAELAAVAAVRAEGFRNVHLMLPFVRWPDEVVWAREQLNPAGLGNDSGLQLWMMVETPSAVIRAEEFAPLIDGVSIGSNDLTQLLLGIDRDNVAFSRRDWDLDRAVVNVLRDAADAYRRFGVPVGICGDAPSRSQELLAQLVTWGLDSISVSVDRVAALHALLDQTTASVIDAEPEPER